MDKQLNYSKEELCVLINDPNKKIDIRLVKFSTCQTRDVYLSSTDNLWERMQSEGFEDVEMLTINEYEVKEKVEEELKNTITKGDLEDKLKEHEDGNVDRNCDEEIKFLKDFISNYDSKMHDIVDELSEIGSCDCWNCDDSPDLSYLVYTLN